MRHDRNYYSEAIKYLITLGFCKFSQLEIMEVFEIFIVAAIPDVRNDTV